MASPPITVVAGIEVSAATLDLHSHGSGLSLRSDNTPASRCAQFARALRQPARPERDGLPSGSLHNHATLLGEHHAALVLSQYWDLSGPAEGIWDPAREQRRSIKPASSLAGETAAGSLTHGRSFTQCTSARWAMPTLVGHPSPLECSLAVP